MAKYSLAIAALIAFSWFAVAANAQTKLTEDRFQELMTSVIPAEKSQLINWYPDLLSAQKVALEQKKPIFIWSMDGHPLGCT